MSIARCAYGCIWGNQGFREFESGAANLQNPPFFADVTTPFKGLLLFGVGSERVAIELP